MSTVSATVVGDEGARRTVYLLDSAVQSLHLDDGSWRQTGRTGPGKLGKGRGGQPDPERRDADARAPTHHDFMAPPARAGDDTPLGAVKLSGQAPGAA
jgi:hypothetical protein